MDWAWQPVAGSLSSVAGVMPASVLFLSYLKYNYETWYQFVNFIVLFVAVLRSPGLHSSATFPAAAGNRTPIVQPVASSYTD
jgi:hypothetical protein